MRLSVILSALLHVAFVAATMVVLADPTRFDVDVPVNIPVELLTIDDVTNIAAARQELEIEEPVEEEELVVEETPPEPEPRQVASLPEPEPVLEEIAPEYDPFSVPDPDVVEAEPEPATPPPPDLGSVRQQMRPEPPNRDFDFGAAAALIDLTPQEEEEPSFDLDSFEVTGSRIARVDEEDRRAVGLGTGLTISEEDALKYQIQECWNVPAGARDAENLIIELRLFLNPDGTVQRTEILNQGRYRSDGFYRAAVDSAVRAVERCQTGSNFDGTFRRGYSLPRDRYDEWRTIGLTFDPSEMF